MHQAADLVTTVRMITAALRVPARTVDIVAEGGIALRALLAWSFLCARFPIGTFTADMKGMDLRDPSCWARHAYFPLLFRDGGPKSVLKLCVGKRAVLTNAPKTCHGLFPASFSVKGQR
jgi:hypothetical protein